MAGKISPVVCLISIVCVFVVGPAIAKEIRTQSGNMVFIAGPAIAFGGGDRAHDFPLLAQFDLTYGYFIAANLALGAQASTVILNPDDKFHYDYGIGPQISLFLGGGEFEGDFRNKLYPYLSLAYIRRWYDWRVRCMMALSSPPPYGWTEGECGDCYNKHGGAIRGTFGVARTISDALGYNVRVALQLKDVNDCAAMEFTLGLDFIGFIK